MMERVKKLGILRGTKQGPDWHSAAPGVRPCLLPRIGRARVCTVEHCSTVVLLFLFANNCSNID
jgi:hypothetical protein